MKIKKGEKVRINCARKGVYDAVALKAFDTLKDEWYPVAVDQDGDVEGLTSAWMRGQEIPCRRGHASVSRRKVKR